MYGVATMLAWGGWIILGEVAGRSIDPRTAAAISYVSATSIAVVYAVVAGGGGQLTAVGVGFAVLAGVGAAIGVIATYVGIASGSTAVVATLGGMYFVIAAVLSIIFFDEPLDLQTVLGIGMAIMAIVVLTTGR
jgi:Predicted membrane protein